MLERLLPYIIPTLIVMILVAIGGWLLVSLLSLSVGQVVSWGLFFASGYIVGSAR